MDPVMAIRIRNSWKRRIRTSIQNLFLSRASLYRANNCCGVLLRHSVEESVKYTRHFATLLSPFWAILLVLMQHQCCTRNRENNIGKNLLICSILSQHWSNEELNSYSSATLSLFSECHRWRSKSISSKNLDVCWMSSALKVRWGQNIPYVVTVYMWILL